MKIEVGVPPFYESDLRSIRVMAGIELIAQKYPGKPWMVKTVHCDFCGKCCMNLGENQSYPITTTDGVCDHLEKEPGDNDKWRCALGLNRPFGCSVGETDADYCCIEWEQAE